LNREIKLYPPEVGTRPFGEWLANNVDWALSRDRFWGTPLPVWLDEDGNGHCVGSVKELSELTGRDLSTLDLHRPFVDEITFRHPKTGKPARRTPEVIDVWFDSGAMPLAQWHYPFENKEIFNNNFPADFISEAVDQTRGWFYSLFAIAAMLFDKPCYKNCVSLELVLDKDGQKMSKSKGNTVDPFQVIAQHGADAVRWYLLTVSPLWQTTRFDVEGVREVVSRFFGTLINTYAFFAMYANIDEFVYPARPIPAERRPEIDRWLISRLNGLVARVEENYEVWDVTRGGRAIAEFVVDDLSNWYVRRCRRRFWKSGMGEDKQAAFETLYEALLTVGKLSAPLAPFISEAIYRRLIAAQKLADESVHLCAFPSTRHSAHQFRQPDLEVQMEAVRTVVVAGRSLRNAQTLKVRQPLRRLIVVTPDAQKRAAIQPGLTLIQDELNVKRVEFQDSAEALTISKAEPIFKSLGPQFGKRANAVAEAIRNLPSPGVRELQAKGRLEIKVQDEALVITSENVRIVEQQAQGLAVATEAGYTIALDTTLDEDLLAEGLARDFVNRVQNMRKTANFEVTDHIGIAYQASPHLQQALQKLAGYIQSETLAEAFVSLDSGKNHLAHREEWEVGTEKVTISIARV
jgi:isoleucyl-tRNA synthetase